MVLRVGLVGCGTISDIYLANAPRFRDIAVVACADLRPEATARQAAAYGIAARDTDELLASPDIDIVLNLTVPDAHAAVSLAALAAGKHVYSEKPLATTLADGLAIKRSADGSGLRIGAAPDTVLGAAVQEARRRIDAGAIGRPLFGVATVLSHGMEDWHPNPGFFFRAGGGPVFDMGPYYLTTLVTLLGPVASVSATAQTGSVERIVSAEGSPLKGSRIPVGTPTTLSALLSFASGAEVAFLVSWDVWRHGMLPLELHGTEGSVRLPDPNWFGGDVAVATGRGEWRTTATSKRVFGRPNWPRDEPIHANHRGLGLAEMARAIVEGRPHRASGDLALHVLAVMAAILRAAETRAPVAISQSCMRPEPLGEAEAAILLA
ncbi:MAG TPA: Gfo/Idh/MocA family oxidoreductase [Lichenihabitans sp.]|jgi:predicted dehydrogenase|nr:Gfo/Idh/MocA family oxidoreductase [Lichenihabitans sp.]